MTLTFINSNNNFSFDFDNNWYYAFRCTSVDSEDTNLICSLIFYNHDGNFIKNESIVTFYNNIKNIADISSVNLTKDEQILFDNDLLDLQYKTVLLKQSDKDYDIGLQFIVKFDIIIT